MKIKKLIYVLVGTLVVASSCSDTEFGNGKKGRGQNRQQVLLWLKCMLMKRESTCSQAIYL